MLSLAIQHHPRRAELLPRLIASLTPAHVQVVFDPEPENPFPSPWRTYRRALETTPTWASHRVVIQDDSVACANFGIAAASAVAARPDRMIAFCVCGEPRQSARSIMLAAEQGWSWAELDLHLWIPAIAVAWPVELIEPALAFVDGQAWPQAFRADDEILGRIATGLGVRALATVPSLIEHEDLVPSLVGKRAAAGRNPGRVAACYIGDCDALTIDWEPGPR